jgi:hypothetical protein
MRVVSIAILPRRSPPLRKRPVISLPPLAVLVALSALVTVSLLVTAVAFGAAKHTQRVSVSSAGAQGNNGSGDTPPSVSSDGRSSATNLVPGDTNGFPDVFERGSYR